MDDKNPLKMKVSELKAELGRRGLSQTGLKFDLAQRLQTAMDVDEFGALPSMTSPSSSPLLSVPGKDFTDHSDFSPSDMQTISCDSAQGGPSDEQARDLAMAAGTKDSETAPPIEQSCLGDASIVADATPSEGGATPATEDILTLDEKLECGEKEHDKNKANRGGADDTVHAGIAADETKLAVDGGGNAEFEGGGVGGSNEKKNVVEECGAAATAGDETPLLSFGSPESEKNIGTEECVRGGENASLLFSDSTNPTSTPRGPPNGTENVEQAAKDQPGVGVEELDEKKHQRNEAKPDDSDQRTGVEGDTTRCDASQRNQETEEVPSEFVAVAPDSLLLSSLTDRMKDREERFRLDTNPDHKEGIQSQVTGKTGSDSPGPSKASGRDHVGSKVDSRRGGGSESGITTPTSAGGDACPEAHGAQTTVEDVRRAKLMKRKERFLAPPFASSGNGGRSAKSGIMSAAKLGAPPVESSSRKLPSEDGVLGEETSGPASSRRQAASEVAAKMARRSERFGVKGAGSSATREATSTEERDPRGSSFAESGDTPEGNTQQSPPPSGGYSFDPLPQRQKRARAATTLTPSPNNDSTTSKRRGVDRGVAGAVEKTTSPDAVEARGNSGEAAKATGRRNVRLLVASSNDVDESPLRCQEKGKPPSPPPSSGKRVSLGSAFVLLGVKRPKPVAPKLSTTTTAAAGKGKGTPPNRLGRGGDEVDGASHHPAERRDEDGKANKPSQQREGQTGTAVAQVSSVGRPCREGQAEKKFAEQAAKMAERRKRFAADPRAPSFR